MCLKNENNALRKQIEDIQRAIELQKSESSLKAEQNSRENDKLQMNVALLTAINAQQAKRLHEIVQSMQSVTSLEEAVQRSLKPAQPEQSPAFQQSNFTTANGSIATQSSVNPNKGGGKKIKNAFPCQDFRLKNPSLKINRITGNAAETQSTTPEFSEQQSAKEIEEKEDWEREFELEDWDKEIIVFGEWKILLD